MTKLTWDSIRERKRRELHKKDYKRADYIAKFDMQKRINILMKLVNDNPPGTYEYSIHDLTTSWEDFKFGCGVFFMMDSNCLPMFVTDKQVTGWLLGEVISVLEGEKVDFERVEGYYRVRITMP